MGEARYHVAIRRPEDDAVLVLEDGAMPGVSVIDAPPWQVVEPVVDGLRADFGMRVEALRTAWHGGPDGDGRVDRLVEVSLVGGRLPDGARWVPLDALDRRPTPLGRAIDAGALDPVEGHRQPWYQAGWLADMTAWVDEALDRNGIRRRGDVRQMRSWGRSALLRIETDRGRVWAKDVPVVFAHEVRVTTLLADIDPGFVPPVVAADPDAGRIILEHVDGPLLTDPTVPRAAWPATMARLAEIQRVLAADLSAARAAGVPSAPLTSLAAAVPAILADRALALVGQPGGLAKDEQRALERATEDLVRVCRALAVAPPGDSLEHGDLSPAQVILSEMGPVFLDWSDATITHPFLAAAAFLADTEPGADEALADAYLTGWGGGGREAARAFALARVVHPLHVAWLYAERILPGLEQPWEMERMVPDALRRLLPRLRELPGMLAA